MLEISVIIPSYNYKTIEHTIIALLNQESAPSFEIIVVDSSDDGETDITIKKFSNRGVTMIKSGVRVMPAIQRNIGAKQAKGKLLIFIDSDVIPGKDLIKNFYNAYKLGCRSGCGSLRVAPSQKANKFVVAQYYLQFNEYTPTGEVRIKDFPAGASVFCDSEIFKKVGGFPESRAAEDVLLGFNINKITNLWFLPYAVSEHIFRENKDSLYANQKLLGRYAAIYRKDKTDKFYFHYPVILLLYPFFVFIKLYRILPRIKSMNREHIFSFIKVFTVFFIGIHYWTMGFIEGSTENIK